MPCKCGLNDIRLIKSTIFHSADSKGEVTLQRDSEEEMITGVCHIRISICLHSHGQLY